jgi:transketolase
MRREFIDALQELADLDERVVLITGDVGFSVLEPFAERHPDRFFNAGVAEQNMVGMATGMAEAGFIPYVYSITTFATLRAYEFIRNGPVLHQLPVRIVGVGAGFDYGHNGVTHYALEDVAVMRAQPGLAIVSPADPDQAVAMLEHIHALPGPAYIRLGRESDSIPGLTGFRLGRLEIIERGHDVAIVALGTSARSAIEAAGTLNASGTSAGVAVAACIEPAPKEDILELASGVRLVITVESHYVTGGLGSLVAEVLAEAALDCRLVRCGVAAMPSGVTGATDYLNRRFGIDARAVAHAAEHALASA